MNCPESKVELIKEQILDLYSRQPVKRFLIREVWDDESYKANPEFDFDLTQVPFSEWGPASGKVSFEKVNQYPLPDEQDREMDLIVSLGQSWELNNGPLLRVMHKPGLSGFEVARLLRLLARDCEKFGSYDPLNPDADIDCTMVRRSTMRVLEPIEPS